VTYITSENIMFWVCWGSHFENPRWLQTADHFDRYHWIPSVWKHKFIHQDYGFRCLRTENI